MFRTASMRKLRIYILERDVQHVAKALGELGVLHLQNSVEDSGGELQPGQLDEETGQAQDLLGRLSRLMEQLEVPQAGGRAEGSASGADPGRLEEVVAGLESAVLGRVEAVGEAERALADTDEILTQLSPYRDVQAPLSRLAESDFLRIRACWAGPFEMEGLREAMPEGVLLAPLAGEEETGDERRANLLVVSSRRRRFAMETILQEHGVAEREIPSYEAGSPADVYRQAVGKRLALQERLAGLRLELRAVGEQNSARLQAAHADLELQLKLYDAEQNFGTTWTTSVISGWVPTERAQKVRATVTDVTNGQSVIEVARPTAEEIRTGRVPIQVVHSRFLAPFGRLVRGYGVATYTEIEPTALFAASFLLMFGIIFGDLGHGLCLLAIGLLIRRLASSPVPRDIGVVVAASGAASVLFGTFLQGSFFGRSLRDMGFSLTAGLEPVGFDGEGSGNVLRYLILALVFGIVIVSLGAILNIVNRLRSGDYEGGLLGGFGLVGIILYWGALGLVVKLLVAGPGQADAWLALLLLGVPLILLALHEPLCSLTTGRRPLWKQGAGMGLFEGAVEAVETGMVYVANTFSFLRVAAFALSHAALCFAVFVFQRLVAGLPGGPVWSAAVFVIGTALIIGLEGLIVAIQILRLEYYEFFTKFFSGEGTPYEPFRLR